MANDLDHEPSGLLRNVRVLIVEDEYYIADDLRRAVEGAGGSVVGPASNVDQALDMIDGNDFDVALVDLNLSNESGIPIADRLALGDRPFAFATGYGGLSIPERFQEVPRLEKPFESSQLIELASTLLSRQP